MKAELTPQLVGYQPAPRWLEGISDKVLLCPGTFR